MWQSASFSVIASDQREHGNLPFELDPIKRISSLDRSTPNQNCRLPRPFAKPIQGIPQSSLAKGLAVTKCSGWSQAPALRRGPWCWERSKQNKSPSANLRISWFIGWRRAPAVRKRLDHKIRFSVKIHNDSITNSRSLFHDRNVLLSMPGSHA